jgi:branched-chain amino acid transport system permease protein
VLNFAGQTLLAGSIDAGQLQNLQKVIFGALIIFLLIKEPEGLVRLFNNLADRFKAWPLRF